MVPNSIRLTASDKRRHQETKDRHEIEALMWRYAGPDTLDAEAYASAYAGRAVLLRAETRRRARLLSEDDLDLKTTRTEREKTEPQPPMCHGREHLRQFPAKDRARHHTYWQTVFGAAGESGASRGCRLRRRRPREGQRQGLIRSET
jgi:hypothetical protein